MRMIKSVQLDTWMKLDHMDQITLMDGIKSQQIWMANNIGVIKFRHELDFSSMIKFWSMWVESVLYACKMMMRHIY
jgi:hypothetical protein